MHAKNTYTPERVRQIQAELKTAESRNRVIVIAGAIGAALLLLVAGVIGVGRSGLFYGCSGGCAGCDSCVCICRRPDFSAIDMSWLHDQIGGLVWDVLDLGVIARIMSGA